MFALFHIFFAPTWGGVPWVYAAEVNSLGWRIRGAAAATSTNWIMVQVTKARLESLRWAFYLVFAVICFGFWPVVFCFYPETSRRTLKDMDQTFMQNPSWLLCGKQEPT